MLNVLIVEDEDIIRQGLVHLIDWKKMGCTVIGQARDGEEGEKLIKALRPDIVLTDIKMPKKNGIKMVEDAMNFCRFKAILLTSHADFDYAQKALHLHIFEYLLKPVDEKILKETVRKIHKELETDISYIKKMSISNAETHSFDFDINEAINNSRSRQVIQVLKKILVSYQEPLNICSLAKEIGVSQEYLSRKLKEETGKTFTDILNMRRIEKSLELLKDGCYLMYEVALISGFSEYKYFSSVFKKYTGKTPGEAKKEFFPNI